jgi:multiple sugar transport system permease protein
MKPHAGRNQSTHSILMITLILMTLVFILPILVTILTAFRTNQDILTHGLWSLPRPLYFGGFKATWVERELSMYVKNSFIITIPAVIGVLFVASLTAHAIANFRFAWRKLILILFFAGLWFPPQTFLVPVYRMAQRVGIYDTYLGLILAHIAYAMPFSALVLSQFFETIPKSVIDAARIDGTGEFQILTNIVWPLSIPALGSVAIFQFTWIWNDFYWGLVLSESANVQPVMVGITRALGRYVFEWNEQSAASLIAISVPLLVFIFFQRFFIEGMKMGSIK